MHAQLQRLESTPPSTPVAPPGEALCVRVWWGECLLSTHVLSRGALEDLTLGASADADVVVPVGGRAHFQLRGGALTLSFTDGVRGELLRNGDQSLAFGELISRGVADEAAGAWVVRLGRRDSVRIDAGALTIEAQRVRPARRVLATLDDLLDYRLLNIALVCAFLAVIGVAEATFAQQDERLDDSLARADVTKLRHVIPVAPLPEQKKQTVAPGSSSPAGSPAPRPMPVAGGSRHGTTPHVDALQAARGVLAGLGAQGVFGSGGLDRALTGAVGSVVGASNGLGGLSLRGSGSSLGGERIGLGGVRIGTRPGSGTGNFALCIRPPCKAETKPEIEVGPSQACAGDAANACMDKELIRKVIHDHLTQVRYCYELQLGRMPSLAGRLSVSFHVAPSGAVDMAKIASSTIDEDLSRRLESELDECLISRVRTWVFPTNRVTGYVVTYPFVFRSSGA